MSTQQVLLDVRRQSLAAGFYAAGESLAVDLVDTIKLKATPVIDLLDGREEQFWSAHRALLPPIEVLPDPTEVRQLRAAMRSIFEARIDGRVADDEAVRLVNETASSSYPLPWLTQGRTVSAGTKAIGEGNPLLAAVARSAISAMAEADELRRCGSPRCSMFYVSASAARLWCSQTCGNRMRVQRSTAAQAEPRQSETGG